VAREKRISRKDKNRKRKLDQAGISYDLPIRYFNFKTNDPEQENTENQTNEEEFESQENTENHTNDEDFEIEEDENSVMKIEKELRENTSDEEENEDPK